MTDATKFISIHQGLINIPVLDTTLMKRVPFTLTGNLQKCRAIYAYMVAKAMVNVAKQRQRGLAVFEFEHIKVPGQP